MSKPSDFAKVFPYCSISLSGSFEGMTQDLMQALADNGNEFHEITIEWLESINFQPQYMQHLKLNLERYTQWCDNEESARAFSDSWKKVK